MIGYGIQRLCGCLNGLVLRAIAHARDTPGARLGARHRARAMQQRTNPDRIDRDREDGFAVLVIDPFDGEQGKKRRGEVAGTEPAENYPGSGRGIGAEQRYLDRRGAHDE